MTVDPTIFRQYDIRGIVDEQLTESTVELIGQAFASYACKRGAKIVTVGQDCRDHSPRMVEALQKGLCAGGLDVIDLGTVTTPMQYFSIFHFEADGGIEVTIDLQVVFEPGGNGTGWLEDLLYVVGVRIHVPF